jgi:hypothetical protein
MTVRRASISRNSKTTTELTFPKYFVSREGIFGALTVVKGWMREVGVCYGVSLSLSLFNLSLVLSSLSLSLLEFDTEPTSQIVSFVQCDLIYEALWVQVYDE